MIKLDTQNSKNSKSPSDGIHSTMSSNLDSSIKINLSQTKKMKPVELLLPVGSLEMAEAAIHNGADAIFMGVPGFNARGRTHDFEMSELQEIIQLCHQYGVKVNLAFNVVIFQDELEQVIRTLEQIIPLNPDAFIVQDLGLVQIIRKMAPLQRIHASTQMTITNHESIHFLEDLNIQRFVLGRENSITEIKQIRSHTEKELEVFVHGALCVSYSGQCFTSESIGGRSANRGQCAQSCRFGYELHVDGNKVNLEDRKYLVSPQDLCGINDVPALVESGVQCFKVEGRLKSPDYVATAARSYRKALDLSLSNFFHPESNSDLNSSSDSGSGSETGSESTPDLYSNSNTENSTLDHSSSIKSMGINYSRGFYNGWLQGVNHQKLVDGRYSSHRGHLIGTIIDAFKNNMMIQVSDPSVYKDLVAGDGLLWSKNNQDQGGFIYEVHRLPKSRLQILFARDVVLDSNLEGRSIYQNHDKELKKNLALTLTDRTKQRRIPIKFCLEISENEPLKALVTDGDFTLESQTSSSFVAAKTKGVSDEDLQNEFSSLSGSIFKLGQIDIKRNSDQALFLSHREIKQLRQGLIKELTEKRQGTPHSKLELGLEETLKWLEDQKLKNSNESLEQSSLSESDYRECSPQLNLLMREKGQVLDFIEAVQSNKISLDKINTIYLDFEFGRDYQESVSTLKALKVKVGVATTRILKPNEYRNLKQLLTLDADIILVRNLGAFQYLLENKSPGLELRGDFSLNITNELTAKYLLSKGLSSLCLSYDLNHQQVVQVLETTKASSVEVTIFQYMPSFHMEHCVFAAFLSKGSSYKDCGKPCEKHDVRMKDQFQNWHQIKADHECRNTMYNAKAQSASRYFEEWKSKGLGFVRYEALKERGDEFLRKIQLHIQLLQGEVSSQELVAQLESFESYGISDGPLSRTREYQSRKGPF